MTTYDALTTRPWRLVIQDSGRWKLLSATGDVLAHGHGGMSEETRLAWVALGWNVVKRPAHLAVGVWSWLLTKDEESIIFDKRESDKVDAWERSRARSEDTP